MLITLWNEKGRRVKGEMFTEETVCSILLGYLVSVFSIMEMAVFIRR